MLRNEAIPDHRPATGDGRGKENGGRGEENELQRKMPAGEE